MLWFLALTAALGGFAFLIMGILQHGQVGDKRKGNASAGTEETDGVTAGTNVGT